MRMWDHIILVVCAGIPCLQPTSERKLLLLPFAHCTLSRPRRVPQVLSRDGHDVQASSQSPVLGARPAGESRTRKAFGDAGPSTPTPGGARAQRTPGIPSKKAERLASDVSLSASPMPPPPSRALDQSSADAEMEALRVKAAAAAR